MLQLHRLRLFPHPEFADHPVPAHLGDRHFELDALRQRDLPHPLRMLALLLGFCRGPPRLPTLLVGDERRHALLRLTLPRRHGWGHEDLVLSRCPRRTCQRELRLLMHT
eukprot:jgi/Mesvir1/2339/Mv25441-RA.1